jgi:hypothetical protein
MFMIFLSELPLTFSSIFCRNDCNEGKEIKLNTLAFCIVDDIQKIFLKNDVKNKIVVKLQTLSSSPRSL